MYHFFLRSTTAAAAVSATATKPPATELPVLVLSDSAAELFAVASEAFEVVVVVVVEALEEVVVLALELEFAALDSVLFS